MSFVNISDYRLWVVAVPDATNTAVRGDDAPGRAARLALGWAEVKNITGISINDNSTERPITSLGDKGWQKSVTEELGITLGLTVDHILDDVTDVVAAGQRLLAEASKVTGEGGNLWVRYAHPAASVPATVTINTGLVTWFECNVQNGSLGVGAGASGGAFNTASYDLVSQGQVYTEKP